MQLSLNHPCSCIQPQQAHWFKWNSVDSFLWLAVSTLSGMNMSVCSRHPRKSSRTPRKSCFNVSGPQFSVMSNGNDLSTECIVCINKLPGRMLVDGHAFLYMPDAQVHIWEVFLSYGFPEKTGLYIQIPGSNTLALALLPL